MARNSENQALIERLEASRRQLDGEIAALRAKFDVPGRIRRHVARRPWLWFGASAGAGLVGSRLLRIRRWRKDKNGKSRGGLLRLVLPTLLPLLKPWFRSLLAREFQRRFLDRPSLSSGETQFPLSKP